MQFSILLILFSGVLARKNNRQRMASFQNFHKGHGNNNKRSADTKTLSIAETEFLNKIQEAKSRQKYFTQFAQNRSVSNLHQRAFDTYYAHYFGKLGQAGHSN